MCQHIFINNYSELEYVIKYCIPLEFEKYNHMDSMYPIAWLDLPLMFVCVRNMCTMNQ